MSRVMYSVVATEDDYYPDIRSIGLFETEEAAQAYANAQPRCVYPWANHQNVHCQQMKRWYDYTVEPIAVEPTEPWAQRAE